MGFRYALTKARITRSNGKMSIAADWLNIGLTPTYDAWQIRYFMEDASGKEIWSGFSTLDLRSILPDQTGLPGVADVKKARRHTDLFENVPETGKLFIQIIDPDHISPCLNLSVRGRNSQGAYFLDERRYRVGEIKVVR